MAEPDPGTSRAETAPPLAMLGRYQLCAELASGGMATVYLARQEGPNGFEKLVALKQIHPHLAKDPVFLELFLDEARIAARINHPNVCAVYDYGEADGIYYLALEYLEGETLRSIQTALEDDPRHAAGEFAAHVAYVIAQACEGLHAAHELKNDDGEPLRIVHRDVSPHNLFVNYDGTVRVVDFGIARAEDQVHQTDTGTIRGKFAYMAPEQIRGEANDRGVDIWALGVCLWELLAGRELFDHPTDASTIFAVSSDTILPPSTVKQWIPPELDAIVMKALAREREERYATARELARDLHRFSATRGTALMAADIAEWVQQLMPEQIEQKRKLIQRAKALGNEARRASGMSGMFGAARGAMFSTPTGGLRTLPAGHSLPMLASVSRAMAASDARATWASGDAPTAAASITPAPVASLGEAPTQAQAPVPLIPPVSAVLAVPVAAPGTQPAAPPAAIQPPRSKRRLGLAIGVAIGAGAAAGAVMFSVVGRKAPPAGEPIAAAPAPPGPTATAPAEPATPPGPPAPPAATAPAASPPAETAPSEPPEAAASEPPEAAASEPPEAAPPSRAPATGRRRRPRSEPARPEAGRGASERSVETAATSPDPAPPDPAPPNPIAPPPAPPVETPAPTPRPKPAPLPAPPPAPPPRPASFEADASIASLTIDGPLAQSVVRRAIERVVPAFRDCYRTAATQASANPGASVKIRMTLDESGRARSARVDPSALPRLSECLRAATLAIRSTTAPDTGNLEATFVVKFAARP